MNDSDAESPAPGPGPGLVPDALLAALAAGELPAGEAASLRSRAANDPALRGRLESAERLEAALLADGLLPVPPGLLADVIHAVRREPSPDAVPAARVRVVAGSGRRSLARAVAAALAVALGAHLALGGGDAGAALSALRGLPVPSVLSPDLGIADSVRAGSEPSGAWGRVGEAMPRLLEAPDLVPGSPAALLAAGAGLLGFGVVAAARRRPRPGT